MRYYLSMRTPMLLAAMALCSSACARSDTNALADAANSTHSNATARAAATPSSAQEPDDAGPNQPPQGPAADEVVLPDSNDPVVGQCIEAAEIQMAPENLRIERRLITRSPQWGIIWRADMRRPDGITARFTCTARSRSYRQVDFGAAGIPPLPGG
jgi:hypothetical protein